jgi:hypothetical protein
MEEMTNPHFRGRAALAQKMVGGLATFYKRIWLEYILASRPAAGRIQGAQRETVRPKHKARRDRLGRHLISRRLGTARVGESGRALARPVAGDVADPTGDLEVAAALSRKSVDTVAAVSVALRTHETRHRGRRCKRPPDVRCLVRVDYPRADCDQYHGT